VGVLPLSASLLARGIPLAPVLVFTFASPLIKPTSFTITTAFLGAEFAVGLLLATALIGLTLGGLVDVLLARGWLEGGIRESVLDTCTASVNPNGSVSASREQSWLQWGLLLTADMLKNARFVAKYILLALVLQVLLRRYVPSSLVMRLAGPQHGYSIALATALGIPLYVNAASAPPLLAGLLGLGMAQGAAMGFMITGTAYSVPSIVTLMTLLKRRALVVFLLVGFTGGMLSGYLYQLTV